MTNHTTLPSGLRLTFDDAGSGAPAVVFIHGAYANRSHFAPQREHLAAPYRVVVPDLRGHGDSDTPDGPIGISDAADDVIAVCDAAGVGRAVLCSHSWPVALVVAEKRPSLVAGIVLLDGAVLFPQALRQQVLEGLVPVLEGPGWAAALQGFLGSPWPASTSPALKARVIDEIGRGPAQLAAPMMRDVMSTDWAEQLTAGAYPLLYVHGIVPLEIDRLHHLRPDALIAAAAAGGHYMTLQVPDQVNAMLDRFLDIVESTGTESPSSSAALGAVPA
jgi:pimeloyl-ACP methyl ester carboxylesterase